MNCFFAVLLLRRSRRERDGDSGRVVETALLVDASGQNLRETEKEGRSDLRLEVRRGNRLEDGGSEETEGAGPQENHQRLGRRLPGMHREVRVHPENRTAQTQTYRIVILVQIT